jgi:hypothetical protein
MITGIRWLHSRMKTGTTANTEKGRGNPPFFMLVTAFFFQILTKKKARKKKSNGQLL